MTPFYIKVKQCKNTINECFFASKIAQLPTHVQRFPRFCPHKIDHSIRPSYHFTTILNDKDASKPVARLLNLPNHSKQHMAVCGLSLHLGSSESRKTLSNPHGINERFLFNEFTLDDFRYMKFIYLHCGEEMKLRDPRS